jgi:5-hydroxyisourate hydrolase
MTHVLDTRLGKPASGVAVTLEKKDGSLCQKIAEGLTNADGRITDLLAADSLRPGTYQIRFETGAYFESTGVKGFYPEVTVVFEVVDGSEHLHVPLLLSPFGYSTYRGS